MTLNGCAVPAWIRPTGRAIDWTPLSLVTAAILVGSVVLGWRAIEVPAFVQALSVAGLAAAAVLGLEDPARTLLEPLPASPVARLSHRVLLLAVGTTLAVVAVVAGEYLLALSPTAEPELAAALVALFASGIAVNAKISFMVDRASEVAAGAVLLWVAVAMFPIVFLPESVRAAWLRHPWIVTAAAVVLTYRATTRRST